MQAFLPILYTYLNKIVWLKHIFTCYLPIRNKKIFYLDTLTFTTLVVFKFLNAWGLNFVHAWDT